jgi:hypothetical protein
MQQVACTLNDGQISERRKRWHDLSARALIGRVQTEHGIQLVFRTGPDVEEELRELALLERDCCAFAEWKVTTADGRAVLDVSGAGDEAIEAVRGMFGTLEPA